MRLLLQRSGSRPDALNHRSPQIMADSCDVAITTSYTEGALHLQWKMKAAHRSRYQRPGCHLAWIPLDFRSCGGSLFSPWCSHLPNAKAGELWNSGGIQLKVESESSFIC
ncbi:hypothetical protein AOLI_G00136940 [Acnodon oligacanthus]